MLLVIDNYDSFTFNLVQYLGEMGVEMQVYRNDQIRLEEALALKPEQLLISPGPCSPREQDFQTTSSAPSPSVGCLFWVSAWGISAFATPSARRWRSTTA